MKRIIFLLFIVVSFLNATLPIANYQMDECVWNGLSKEVKDISTDGIDNSGSITGNSSITKTGKIYNAGSFSGGAIDINDLNVSTTSNDKTTVAFWMYWDGTDGVMPFGWGLYDLWFSNGKFGFNTFNSDVYGIADSTSLKNSWHHIVAVFNNGDYTQNKLYIDGLAQTLSQQNTSENTSNAVVSSNARIGGTRGNNGYRFKGKLDEFKIWNGEVSASSVQIIYNYENNGKNYDGSVRTTTCIAPIVNYQLDEWSWNGILNEVQDSSGNGYDITAKIGTNTDINSSVGGGICHVGIFDGNTNKLSGSFTKTFTNAVTMTAWFQTSGGSNGYGRLLEFASHGGDFHYSTALAYDSTAKIIRGWTTNSSGTRSAEVSYDLQGNDFHDGNWHFIAYVYNGIEANLYIDNSLVNSVNTNINTIETPNTIAIGGYALNDSYNFKGNVDEVKIFDSNLSVSKILEIYNYEKNGKNYDGRLRSCSSPYPIANYQMDECVWNGLSKEVKDISTDGIDNSGTITGNTSITKLGQIYNAGSFSGGAIDINDLNVSTTSNDKTTVAFWMYWDGTDGVMPFGWGLYDLWFSNGKFGFNTFNSDVYGIADSTSLKNSWHHIVAVFNNGDYTQNKIYIDGVAQVLSQQNTSENTSNAVVSSNARIGGTRGNNGYRFKGKLDEFKIWNGEVSASNVQIIYNYENNGKNYDGSGRVNSCCNTSYNGPTQPLEFEGSEITLNLSTNSPHWTHVDFNESFTSKPIVFILPEVRGEHPAAVRIKNISKTGFDAVFAEPQGEDGPHFDQNINFLAVNEGIHKIGNTYFQVGKISTNKIQQANKGSIIVDDWENINNIFPTCTPAVVGQIQSLNNEIGLDIPNAGSIVRSNPWITTAIDVNTSGVYLALERGETNEGNVSNNETIGYMIAPPNIQDSVIDNHNNNITFETIVVKDYFLGWDNSCKSINFINSYTKTPLVAANKNSKNEKDGGWIRRCELNSLKIGLQIDEDGSLYSTANQGYLSPPQDTERSHIAETASIFVFSGTIVIRETPLTASYFDAWDVTKSMVERTISTKKVSQNFDLSIVALNATNDALQDYNGTVQARIVYANSCPAGNDNITPFLDVNLSNKQENITFSVTKAVKEARVQIKTDDNTTCSTDNFAIRPDKFNLTLPTVGYAGENFNIDFNATNGQDYNETLNSSFLVESNISKSVCFNAPLHVAPFSFVDGAKSVDANYSDVGDINITIKEILGSEFAVVDKNDTADADRLITPDTKSMTIKPYELNVTNVVYDEGWLYMADVGDINQKVKFSILVNDKQHNLVQNFTDICYAQDVDVKTHFVVENSNSVVQIKYDDNTTHSIDDINRTITIPKASFVTSKADEEYSFNIVRDFKIPYEPIKIGLREVSVESSNIAKIENNATVSFDRDFYYGRVKAQDLSTNKQTTPHSLHVEVFKLGKYQQNSLNWYLNEDDNNTALTFTPKVNFSYTTDKTGVNILNIATIDKGTIAFDMVNSWSSSDSSMIHLDIPIWLWYSKYNDYNATQDCSQHPCFEYGYIKSDAVSGIQSGDFSGSSIGNDYNATKQKIGVKTFR